MDNYDYRLRTWIKHELAARKIQRNYRQWRQSIHLKRRIKIGAKQRLRCFEDVLSSGESKSTTAASASFQAVLNQTATFDQKCHFWRLVIDLRRSHLNESTDMLIRALIEADGELSRAIVLLGNKEFTMQNTQLLPQHIKAIFLPSVGPFEYKQTSQDFQFMKNVMASTSRGISMAPGSPEKKGRNLDMIRSLRNKHLQVKKQELMDIFTKTIEKAYFTPTQKALAGQRLSSRPKG